MYRGVRDYPVQEDITSSMVSLLEKPLRLKLTEETTQKGY